MDEITAIRRLKEGAFGWLEYLMVRYQIETTRFEFFTTRNKTRTEDVVLDVFLRIFHRSRHFDEISSFKPYPMRSALRT